MIADLKEFLDEKADFYNRPEFIENDPIQIPHRFSLMQDIEIAGFLTATISWGNRKSIIQDAYKMLDFMEHSPFDFIMNFLKMLLITSCLFMITGKIVAMVSMLHLKTNGVINVEIFLLLITYVKIKVNILKHQRALVILLISLYMIQMMIFFLVILEVFL